MGPSLAAKTSSSKKRRIATRRSPKESSLDTTSADIPIESCEPDNDPNFSFTSATFAPTPKDHPAYLRADSIPPASSLPPRLQTSASAGHGESPNSAASSPSGAYAELSLESDRGPDTPPGAVTNSSHTSLRGSSPFTGKPTYHRAIMGGAADFPDRASSPLKRRASSMDPEAQVGGDEDVDMISATPAPDAATDSARSVGPSDHIAMGHDDATGSAEGDGTLQERVPSVTMTEVSQPPPSIEAHIKSIRTFCEEFETRPLAEGDQAYVVSRKWVESVIGDPRDPKKSSLPDASSVTPVDNSDIIWEVIEDPTVGKTADPLLRYFVRLKPGIGPESFTLFPSTAWELIMEWPGLTHGQIPILRTAHKTNEDDFNPNVELEMNPPILTIHRLWSANSPIPIKQIIKTKQPPPVRLARSRTTTFKTFLSQAKMQTDIDLKHKVRVWRVPRKLPAAVESVSLAPTPPASPQPSDPNNPQDSWPHLLLDVETFCALEDKVERDRIDMRDVTLDPSYNGHVDLVKLGLSTDQAVVLDEWVEGVMFVSTYSPSKAAFRSSSTSLAVGRNNRSGRTSPAPSGPLTRGRAQKSSKPIGCVGLSNLGNTCYMNAALQCVRAVPELTKYFLLGEWESEVNTDNVLGHDGNVARVYASLLKEIYRDSAPGSVTPRQFKNTVGRYAPAFSGYGQQDSQEFVGFLLDGLQEDLSRVKKKPYIEKPDSTDEMIGNPEAIREMAEKVWDITKRRDDSVIADLFTGLYKSTLVCPDTSCAKVSITFDPFTNLTLPLPVENKWSHIVKFFPLNDKPIDIRVELDKTSSIRQLKVFLSSRTGVPVERIHGAEEWKGKFYKNYANGASASDEIGTNDNPYFYEVETAPSNWNSAESRKHENASHTRRSLLDEAEDPGAEVYDSMLVPVIHRKPAQTRNSYGSRFSFCLVPHFIIVNPDEARSEDSIRRKILQKVATFTRHDLSARREDSDSSDSVEFANGSDLSSESKVVAQSVQGEDDMVDVTMKDSPATKATSQEKLSPSKYPFKNSSPAWLDPTQFLPGDLQNLFELSYFTESGSLLANGMHGVDETKEYPRISSRAPEPSGSEDANDSATNGTVSNEETSSDELSHPSSELPPTRMAEESDEDDNAPIVKIPHRPKPIKADTRLPGGRKKMKPGKKYGKKGQKRLQKQAAATSRKQQQESLEAQSPPETVDTGSDGGPLVRLREGIVVDWAEDAYNALFENSNGTWEQCDTMPDPDLDKAQNMRAKRKRNGITLDMCLDEFEREEVLSEQDTWYCPRCKQHQRASKKFDLWKTPDVLIVHLKRFSSSGWSRSKLDVLVDFPIEGLDLTQRVLNKESGKEEIYDLIGVDCHWGGIGGGHYTAHAKNFVDHQWYTYNDSSVSKANPDKIVDSSAYLLFYRRRSDTPLGGRRFKEIVDAYDNPVSDEEFGDSGEGRRLDEGSSPTGSSSAYPEQEAGATRLLPPGTRGGRALGSGLSHINNAYETQSDDGRSAIRRSIEDEGIDMTEDPTNHTAAAFSQTWNFTNLTSQNMGVVEDGVTGSPPGSGVATDEAQHDSSGDEVFSPRGELDPDTDMDNLPGVGHYELGPAPEPDPPSYDAPVDPSPPVYDLGMSRDDVTRIWDTKQSVHRVPATAEDQRSEEAAEIHLDDEDKAKLG